MISKIRNIAIVAHVDHGKTTLVNQLLRQSGTLDQREILPERAMDSNDLERERGITILSKNTSIIWLDYRINIVDTPGHADFGGEVERVLSMVDSVLLLVDAVDGPMPQTRFVTQKAFAHGLHPIVVINKMDRPEARPEWVINATFDLFDKLGASDEQLDFPVIFSSATLGWATDTAKTQGTDMTPLFDAIVKHCPPPDVNENGPLQLQLSSLDYSSYVGAIGIGRIARGVVRRNQAVTVLGRDGSQKRERITKLYSFHGLTRIEVEQAQAGDIVAVAGIETPGISDTICDSDFPEALPQLVVDEPTISMGFETNTSPFCGQDGKFVTSRQLRERLYREALHNVALRVADTSDPEKFVVSGRGELHLSILIETMRREGYELCVTRPQVIYREQDGVRLEPWERLSVDLDVGGQGKVMEALGERGAELTDINPDGKGRVRLDYLIAARGLIGFQTEFRTLTSGTGLMHHVFEKYAPAPARRMGARKNGVLISNGQGKVPAFALFNLQERGKLITGPGDEIYEGQIVGIHNRENDLTVNPLKAKQLTNIRAAGRDENILLTPKLDLTLEQALEFIADGELVEVTPSHIRLRKRYLKEHERKSAARRSVVA